MQTMNPRALLAILLILAVTGCSGYKTARQAHLAEQSGDWDQAVLAYLELVDRHPDNLSYRTGLLRAKIKASLAHFEQGKDFHAAGVLAPALEEYQAAVQLDPSNQYARVELDKLRFEIAEERRHPGPTLSLEEMKEKTRGARAQPPSLNPRSDQPISLSFPKPVSIFDIYRALGKAFGINVLFDPKLRDQEIAIELEEVVAKDSLEILMRSANHFYKVLDEHTIIVVEDNPQNRRNYEDLVIQTFFLSNSEVKDTMTMLRSLVGAKNIAANEQLNAIILRDSADKVKVAERIIRTNDKSRGELVVDVELLQIGTSKLQELGMKLSSYQVTQQLDPALQVGDTGGFRFSDLQFINQSDWIVTIPAFIYDFMKQSSEAQLLASPQLRISDGEKATLHIGDRVPIPVTTFNTGSTIGGNIVPLTSFQYQDVGIRLDLEPRIHHNKEITLKIKVEVSALSGSIAGSGGQDQPIIATRNIESTIRLMDGETNFLAGLIRTDEAVTDTGFPGLSDIPVLGRLFTHRKTDFKRTDLILTLTPHIIRTPDITEEDLLPIWVGTEANITFRGGSPRVESAVEGPFDEDADEEADRIREMIRRRIQNLPRGLLEGEEAPEPEESSPGQDLVPSAAPRDPFQSPSSGGGGSDGGGEPLASILSPLDAETVIRSLETDSELEVDAQATDGVALDLAVDSKSVSVGDVFEVRVEIEAVKSVHHVPVTLSFDGALLEVQSIEDGGFMGSGQGVVFMADSHLAGTVVLGVSLLGDGADGVTGSGIVARITMKAMASGETKIRFEKGKPLNENLKAVTPNSRSEVKIEIAAGALAGPDGM